MEDCFLRVKILISVEIRHLEYILNLINVRCLKIPWKGGKAAKFTASEDIAERMELIDLFNKAILSIL